METGNLVLILSNERGGDKKRGGDRENSDTDKEIVWGNSEKRKRKKHEKRCKNRRMGWYGVGVEG